MLNPSRLNRKTLTIAGMIISVLTLGQDPSQVLETTRKIADKIIRETVFGYKMVPLSYNGGITRFTVDDPNHTGETAVYYAFGKMNSEKDTTGWLGISFMGQIKVFLNNEEIFQGTSNSVMLQEYTYNRYRFHHRIPVQWKKGENEILVKCTSKKGPVKVLLLPQASNDKKEPSVYAIPVTEETPNTTWLTCGPWFTEPGEEMNHAFPPENSFEEFYGNGKEIIGWNMTNVPLLRELIIPETNSYTRDSYADWHYANGGTMLGILSLYQVTEDEAYLEFVKQFAENLWENDAYFRWQYFNHHAMRGSFHRIHRMAMLDDSGGPALPFAELQLLDPETPFYLPVLFRIFDYVMNGQERLPDRTFSRPEPEPATVWADDLFMAVPFLLRMAKITGESELYDEVALQVIQFNKYLSNPETGLYFHGWYQNRKENTPVQWGRANGWIIWATSEALLHMPENHPEYKTVLKIFRNHMEAIAGYQDGSGMWHQVLDHPETFEETSCTAMFTLGMARGVRMGWLNKKYKDRALKGWDALQDKIGYNGTVKDICRGTSIGDDVDFYETRKRFDHDPRGLGAMLTAGCEIHQLLEVEE